MRENARQARRILIYVHRLAHVSTESQLHIYLSAGTIGYCTILMHS